jgi:hypothetical protein
VPKDSLKFFYGPDDDPDSKGGFTTVSVGTDTMNVTFYNYKGRINKHSHKLMGVCTDTNRCIDDHTIARVY